MNIGLAYFYFSYRKHTPVRNVALALLQQLCLQSLSPIDEVAGLEMSAAKSEYIAFHKVVSALQAVVKRFPKMYIILDALDECPPAYRRDLLHLLRLIRDSPARLLVSSRPHLTFDIFEDSPKIDIVPSPEDIKLYTAHRLEEAHLLTDNEILLRTIISNIVDASMMDLAYVIFNYLHNYSRVSQFLHVTFYFSDSYRLSYKLT